MKLVKLIGTWTNPNGYIQELWFTDGGKPFIISQHRRVFQEHYKRQPKSGYDIHHIDSDKSNNEIWNLIEVNRDNHRLLHHEGDRDLHNTTT